MQKFAFFSRYLEDWIKLLIPFSIQLVKVCYNFPCFHFLFSILENRITFDSGLSYGFVN